APGRPGGPPAPGPGAGGWLSARAPPGAPAAGPQGGGGGPRGPRRDRRAGRAGAATAVRARAALALAGGGVSALPRKVAVVGAGDIGADWAALCAGVVWLVGVSDSDAQVIQCALREELR